MNPGASVARDRACGLRAQPDRCLREHLAMADAECLDPALPAGDVADERAELDELRLAEVCVELRPELVIGTGGVPADRIRVAKRDPFAVGEERRGLVVVEPGQLVLAGDLLEISVPSRPDGSLVASVAALERLRNAEAAELLQVDVDDATLEQPLPRVDERAQHLWLLRADGLDLRARRALQHRFAEDLTQLGILEFVRVDVADAPHRLGAYPPQAERAHAEWVPTIRGDATASPLSDNRVPAG
jgi:hypothetical protein